MKKLFTITFLALSLGAFAQLGSVSPSSSTQGNVTATGSNVTNNNSTVITVPYSMQDLDRLNGSYENGVVDTQTERIHIRFTEQIPSELDFSGIIISSSPEVLELDGFDEISKKSMQLQISLAPKNKKTPKELYTIKVQGLPDVWILKEDITAPKN